MIIRKIYTQIFGGFSEKLLSKLLGSFLNLYEFGELKELGRKTSRAMDAVEVSRAANGEIIVAIGDNKIPYRWMLPCGLDRRNDAESRRWMALQIKNLVRLVESKADPSPGKNNDVKAAEMSSVIGADVTFGELFCLCDALAGNKRIKSRYGESLVLKIRGSERDPLTTEAERARRKRLDEINSEFEAKIAVFNAKIDKDLDAEIDTVMEMYERRREIKIKECKTERDRKINELISSFGFGPDD